jgi:hypothetical protein
MGSPGSYHKKVALLGGRAKPKTNKPNTPEDGVMKI